MRNFIILTILALVFFATGWTIYRFVANRSQEVVTNNNNAPSLQQAPTATPTVKPSPVPAVVRITPTPTPQVSATPVVKVSSNSQEKIPTTGPGMVVLGVMSLAVSGGIYAASMPSKKRKLAKAYKQMRVL